MLRIVLSLLLGTSLFTALNSFEAAQAQTVGLTDAEVKRHLSGRTFQMRRGPATFSRNGDYRFVITGGQTVNSTWSACGSAVCLANGWRGALAVDAGNVVLTDPQGNRINLGKKQ